MPTAAYVGDRNVAVICAVLAKPSASALFWIIDANGTSLPPPRRHNTTLVNESLTDDQWSSDSLSRWPDDDDANGTSVKEGDRIADHWTLESVRTT